MGSPWNVVAPSGPHRRNRGPEQLFGLAIERLEVVIAERPRGDAIMVLHLLEVTAAESWRQAPYILVFRRPSSRRLAGTAAQSWRRTRAWR